MIGPESHLGWVRYIVAQHSPLEPWLRRTARVGFLDDGILLRFKVYTNCSLTYSSDKLYAISGIVKIIQQATGLSYVSGIWSELAAHCLLWSGTPLRASDEARIPAPSWSWVNTPRAFGSADHDLP